MSRRAETKDELLDAVGAAEAAFSAYDWSGLDPAHEEGFRAVLPALAYVRAALEGSQPLLISREATSLIEGPLVALAVADTGVIVDGVDGHIDSLLRGAALLPAVQGSRVIDALATQVSEIQRSLSARRGDIEGSFAALEEGFEDWKRQAAEWVSEAHADGQAELEALRAEVARLQQMLAQTESNAQRAITGQEETFRLEADRREASHAALMATSREEFQEALGAAHENATLHVAELARMEKEGRLLVAAVAQQGTADRYGVEAVEQRKAANVWRLIAVCALVLVVVVAGVAVSTVEATTDWRQFGGKFVVGVALAGLAGYANRESVQHRERERRARGMELELAAFGPFIEPLDDQQKEAARVGLLPKVFRGQVGVGDADED